MNKTKCLILAGLLSAAPFASADLSYTYVSAGYVLDGEFDGSGVDLDGISLSGSFALNNEFYLLGNYHMLETDPGNVDVDRIDLGAGFHTPIAPGIDFDISLAYSDAELGPVDTDGYQLKGGLRGLPSDVLEWSAYLIHEDLEDSDTGFELSGRYFFAPAISGGLALRDVNDIETLTINLRFDF